MIDESLTTLSTLTPAQITEAMASDSDDGEEQELPDPDYENLLDYFPKKPRDNQVQILQEIQKGLLDPNIKFILVDSPTGTGKSVLAISAGRASGSAYQSTSNKALQDQYERDFPECLATLKGRANYKCLRHPIDGETYVTRPPAEGFNCGNAPCRSVKRFKKTCSGLTHEGKLLGPLCEYSQALNKAAQSPLVSFNSAALMAFINHTSKFDKRNLIVLDECHGIGSAITNFVELTLSGQSLEDVEIQDLPDYSAPEDYDGFVDQVFTATVAVLRPLIAKDELDEYEQRRMEKLEAMLKKLMVYRTINKRGENEPSNMAVEKIYHQQNKRLDKVTFKPVKVDKIAHEYLFQYADKIIMMSATLNFDIMLQTLGIPLEQAQCIRVSSPFPKENRPIYRNYVGRLNYKNIEQLTPRLIEAIRAIMTHHGDQKGIIHGVSYKLCKALNEGLRGTDRILFPSSSAEQRDVLDAHFKTKNPTVLLSPSMTEGIDLVGDLSRFQILVKMPYPSLGDPLVQQRMLLYQSYYAVQTGLTLVQAYGRSVRSATDSCITYILDGQFESFLQQNENVLPPWFVEAIVGYKTKR